MRIGVVGLGAIGMGVATSLIRSGAQVCGIDLRPEKQREILAAGAAGSGASAGEFSERFDAVVLCVVNAEQCEQVLFGPDGLAASLSPGSTVLMCATAAPARVRAMSARLAEQGISMLDAPVSGGAARAAEGALTIMLSGAPEIVATMRPVLDSISARVYNIGPDVGQASMVKVVHQLLAGVHIAAAAEAMALATRVGIDPDVMYDVVTNSAGNSWMFADRMKRLIDGDAVPRSTIDIFVKDLGLVSELGVQTGQPLPLTGTALDLFSSVSTAGGGALDDSQVVRALGGLTPAGAAS